MKINTSSANDGERNTAKAGGRLERWEKELATRLKYEDGASWTELPHKLAEETGNKYTFNQCRNAVRRFVGTREGQEERKPDIIDCGDYYKVTSGKRTVEITKDKLKQIKSLYCGDNPLTINQICRKVDIPRRDFVLVKTAFDITHDDVPYTDEEIQNKPTEELVKETLEKRKEKYFLKLQQEEINQLKQEVARYRKQDYFINKLHEITLDHFEEFLREYQGPVVPLKPKPNTKEMLEVSIVDLHLGKMAWKPETGENYDYKIADRRFMSVIYDVVERSKQREFEQILFPVGQDFFNFDTIEGTTTRGTRQDNDLRWQKLYVKGVEMLVKAIDILTQIAPVKTFLVPGNHDTMTSFYAIMHLSAYFKDNPNVEVNISPQARKYIEFGKCLIGFTHGDKEKKRIFGNMQVEAAQAWGRTRYREWHASHLHSEHVREEHGIKLRRLSSVTGTDAYHYESGYAGAIATSQSFVWDKDRGLRDIWYSTVEV